MIRTCRNCKSVLTHRYNIKYCSNRCQQEDRSKFLIKSWKSGIRDGMIGVHTRALSTGIRRYLIQKNGEKCSICAWNKKNPITGRVPLEVDHIDGDSENNKENNLRLLCPNCHSLTPFFRNLNKGKGRKWRMDKYKRNPVLSAKEITF